MKIKEVNSLLSIELELMKEMREYESDQHARLKEFEQSKAKRVLKNKEDVKNTLAEIRNEQLEKTHLLIQERNKQFLKEIKKLNSMLESKNGTFASEIFTGLLDEIKNVCT